MSTSPCEFCRETGPTGCGLEASGRSTLGRSIPVCLLGPGSRGVTQPETEGLGTWGCARPRVWLSVAGEGDTAQAGPVTPHLPLYPGPQGCSLPNAPQTQQERGSSSSLGALSSGNWPAWGTAEPPAPAQGLQLPHRPGCLGSPAPQGTPGFWSRPGSGRPRAWPSGMCRDQVGLGDTRVSSAQLRAGAAPGAGRRGKLYG